MKANVTMYLDHPTKHQVAYSASIPHDAEGNPVYPIARNIYLNKYQLPSPPPASITVEITWDEKD